MAMVTKRRNGLFNEVITLTKLRKYVSPVIKVNDRVFNTAVKVKLGYDGYVIYVGSNPELSEYDKENAAFKIVYGYVTLTYEDGRT